MHVESMANIRVCANNIQATLQVAVSSELKETMLISCDDLRKLCVIPADFPNVVLTVKQPNPLSSLKAMLLRLFDKTLSDDLNPEPMRRQQPGNVKELRSFLGLVAQFGAFAPDTACLTSHLRQLLQKETPWV